MEKTRTMVFQISEELFEKIKSYLSEYEAAFGKRLTQRKFIMDLIENGLEEGREELEALNSAKAAEKEDTTP